MKLFWHLLYERKSGRAIIGIRATYFTRVLVWGRQQLTSFLNVPKCQKTFPMAIIKISSQLNMEAQLLFPSLSYYTAKILKRYIMYIYWAISHSNQKTSDFQVSSTSKNELDASVLWLWSNQGLPLSRQSSVVWQNHWVKSLLLL